MISRIKSAIKKEPLHILWMLVAVVLVVYVAFAGVLLFSPRKILAPDGIETTAHFADAFGMLNTFFSGLGFAGLVATLYLQRRQISDSLDEVKESIRTQKELVEQVQLGDLLSASNDEYLARPNVEKITLQDAHRIIRDECNENGKRDGEKFKNFLEALKSEAAGNRRTPRVEAVEALALAIQRLGFRIMSGSIPLGPVLASNALVLADDWCYCKEYVKDQQEKHGISDTVTEGSSVFNVRRHGEWLAYLAVMYLYAHWKGEWVDSILKEFGDLGEVRRKVDAIGKVDGELMPNTPRLRKEVEFVTGAYDVARKNRRAEEKVSS